MRQVRAIALQYDAARELRRATVLWVLVRLPVMALWRHWDLPVGFAAIIVILVPALCHVDARVMREPLFYANLGRPPWVQPAVAAVVAVTLELLVALVANV